MFLDFWILTKNKNTNSAKKNAMHETEERIKKNVLLMTGRIKAEDKQEDN